MNTSDTVELHPCPRFAWERIVRRCLIEQPVKLVAFTLAQYGDQDGTNIRPGFPRLAAVLGMGESTIRKHVAQLRRLGLLEQVSRGGGRGLRGATAVYRLVIPGDLPARTPMLDTDERLVMDPSAWLPHPEYSATHDERSIEPDTPLTPGYSATDGELSIDPEDRYSARGNERSIEENSAHHGELSIGPTLEYSAHLRALEPNTPLAQSERLPTKQTPTTHNSGLVSSSPAAQDPPERRSIESKIAALRAGVRRTTDPERHTPALPPDLIKEDR